MFGVPDLPEPVCQPICLGQIALTDVPAPVWRTISQ